MLRTIGLLATVLLPLVLLTQKGARADTPTILLVEDNAVARDLNLTVHARQALSADPELVDLTVTIRVRQGVAELRGQVPSEALAAKVRRTVAAVPGILGTRNYLEVRPPAAETTLNLEPEGPSAARAESPGRFIPPEIPANIPTIPMEVQRGPRPMPQPTPAAPAPAPPTAQFLAPVFTEEPATPAPAPEPVVAPPQPTPATPVRKTEPAPDAALAALLAEPAFRGIQADQRGGTVTVRTQPGQGATTMAFARRLRDLPGVEEIVLVPEGR